LSFSSWLVVQYVLLSALSLSKGPGFDRLSPRRG